MIENRDAQFMLLASFIIAIGLVITTVVLNSIIFESNMAVESGNEFSKNEIVNLIQITKDEVRSAYRDAIGGNNTLKFNNFTYQMRNFSADLPKMYALRGAGVNVSWDIEKWNNSQYANFTENGMAGGSADWIVVEAVRNTTVFEFTNTGVDDYFLINVTNSLARLWSMNITTSNITVINKTGGSTSHAFANYINVLEPIYEFNTSTLNEAYTIYFIHGSKSWGRFAIEGNNTIYNKKFIRQRDFILNSTVAFSTSRVRANITVPVSVPW